MKNILLIIIWDIGSHSRDDLVYDEVGDDFFDSTWRNRCEREGEDLASCAKSDEETIELTELKNARKQNLMITEII